MSLTPCFIFCHGTCIFPSVPDDVASPDVAGAPDLVGPRVGLGGGTAPPSARVAQLFAAHNVKDIRLHALAGELLDDRIAKSRDASALRRGYQ